MPDKLIELDLSRRDFIRTVVVSAATLVLLPAFADADSGPLPYVDLGAVSQFSGSDWTRVVLPDKFHDEVVFVRSTDSGKTFQALGARCTHRGCTVSYNADDKDFHCPCHGGVFDNTGKNIDGPPKRPLPNLDAKVDANSHLLVQAPPMTSSHED